MFSFRLLQGASRCFSRGFVEEAVDDRASSSEHLFVHVLLFEARSQFILATVLFIERFLPEMEERYAYV